MAKLGLAAALSGAALAMLGYARVVRCTDMRGQGRVMCRDGTAGHCYAEAERGLAMALRGLVELRQGIVTRGLGAAWRCLVMALCGGARPRLGNAWHWRSPALRG